MIIRLIGLVETVFGMLNGILTFNTRLAWHHFRSFIMSLSWVFTGLIKACSTRFHGRCEIDQIFLNFHQVSSKFSQFSLNFHELIKSKVGQKLLKFPPKFSLNSRISHLNLLLQNTHQHLKRVSDKLLIKINLNFMLSGII